MCDDDDCAEKKFFKIGEIDGAGRINVEVYTESVEDLGLHKIQFQAIDPEYGLYSKKEFLVVSIVDSCESNAIYVQPLANGGEIVEYDVR